MLKCARIYLFHLSENFGGFEFFSHFSHADLPEVALENLRRTDWLMTGSRPRKFEPNTFTILLFLAANFRLFGSKLILFRESGENDVKIEIREKYVRQQKLKLFLSKWNK